MARLTLLFASLSTGCILFSGLLLTRCGDAIINEGEECDDGNEDDSDNCSSACALRFCGDGVQNSNEECDDGNLFNGDGCDDNCLLEVPSCGNGAIDIGEVCDDGNLISGDGCRADCLGVEVCGDVLIDPGEVCDDGNLLSGDGCRADCQKIEICQDGVQDAGEQCDDGNNINDDACSNTCQLVTCGDGVLDVGEQCDDGNNADGDGCEAGCQFVCGGDVGQARSVQDGAFCLLGFDTIRSWVTAESDCSSRGGHLASIASNTENNLVATAAGNDLAWIGLNDFLLESTFSWSDGALVVFENFDNGEPNDTNGNEDCVHIRANGRWNDASCLFAFGYVCKL